MPQWNHKINLVGVWPNTETNAEIEEDSDGSLFKATRDDIVSRIKSSSVYQSDETLHMLTGAVQAAGDMEEFNEVWESLYNHCDRIRIWVQLY